MLKRIKNLVQTGLTSEAQKRKFDKFEIEDLIVYVYDKSSL